MKFKVFTELLYNLYSPTTFIFNIQPLKSLNQKINFESLEISNGLIFNKFSLKNNSSRFIKVKSEDQSFFSVIYTAEVEVNFKLIPKKKLINSISLYDLNPEILPFLAPSRHCPSDQLMKIASKLFDHYKTDLDKVQAINDWIFNNVDYVIGSSNASTSAYDTLNQREGVCKDFAHLGIALCRALKIPARYFTGFGYNIYPADFHACFEAYISGEWIFFDPTNLVPINGLVKISHSKDASESAVASFFGNTYCTYLNVKCETTETNFIPIYYSSDSDELISY